MIHVGDDEQALAGRREGIQVVDIPHQSEFARARVSNPGFGGQRERRLDLLDDLIGRPVIGRGIRGRVQRDRGRPAGILLASGITATGAPSRPPRRPRPRPRRSPAAPRRQSSA